MSNNQPKRKRSPWFAFYPDDYIAGTRCLSLAAKGAFVDLLSYQFSNGSIPSDEKVLCRIVGASSKEWRSIRGEVLPKFEDDGEGGMINRRMEKEREEREGIRIARVAAASKGKEKRWQGTPQYPDEEGLTNSQRRSRRLANARLIARHSEAEWEALRDFCAGCVRCGIDGHLVKDHITPIYQGGSDGIDNVQPLCPSCNSSKGPETTDHRPHGWQEHLKRLANMLEMPHKTPDKRHTKRHTTTTTTTEEEYADAYPSSSPPTPAIAWSPGGGWEGISSEDRDSWAAAYPACDLDRQLAAMHEWLRSNPAKARKRHWRRFVTNWLERSQERGGDAPSAPRAHQQRPQKPTINDYDRPDEWGDDQLSLTP